MNPIYSCPQRGPVEKKALPPTGIPRSKLRPAMASDKGAKLCSDGTYMVVATDVTAYQNPKKERPPFVPVEKKEVLNISRDSYLLTNIFVQESDEEVIPDELSCDLCHELVREPVKTPCCYSSYCRDCISKELLAQGPFYYSISRTLTALFTLEKFRHFFLSLIRDMPRHKLEVIKLLIIATESVKTVK